MSDEKTEEPTALRLRTARMQGNVPRCPDLVAAVTMLAGLGTLLALWGHSAHLLAEWLEGSLGELDRTPRLLPLLGLLAQVLLPIGLASMVGSLGVQWAYSGWNLTSLKVEWSRLNPLPAAQRMFSRKMLVEAVRLGIKVAILAVLGWGLVRDVLLPWVKASHNLASCPWLASRLVGFVGRVGLAYFSLGLLDALYQKWEYRQGLKMSRDEVKREYKQQEGDPMLKAKARQLARKLSKSRSVEGTRDATVVITNPTRLAIALKYAPPMRAPVVVARGKGAVAAQIRKLARENRVPMVEDRPLARALITVDVGKTIPPEVFAAVAQILVTIAKAEAGLR